MCRFLLFYAILNLKFRPILTKDFTVTSQFKWTLNGDISSLENDTKMVDHSTNPEISCAFLDYVCHLRKLSLMDTFFDLYSSLLWNRLPESIKDSSSIVQFKNRLKSLTTKTCFCTICIDWIYFFIVDFYMNDM